MIILASTGNWPQLVSVSANNGAQLFIWLILSIVLFAMPLVSGLHKLLIH